ncbi:hypothetical protein Scep_002312 [Stephania cephalantha]|uniref:ACT domain-containing protein n=1 Tax=Stephania cephalantha TaxID=152367 RepID=A0AAP0L9X5_9MAGN
MELIEEVGESSSPLRSASIGVFGGYDVRTDVFNRLVESGNEEVLCNPEFRDQLDAHFKRLPTRYGLDVNMDRVEDVLLHQKLLALAKDPEKRPVFHVRSMENVLSASDGNDDLPQSLRLLSTSTSCRDAESDGVAPSKTRKEVLVPVYEVIFSTIDKPKLLSQLSALLSDIGLNIREAHVFSTTDRYSLDVFVVDGWPLEDPRRSPPMGIHVEIPTGILIGIPADIFLPPPSLYSYSRGWRLAVKALMCGQQSRTGRANASTHEQGGTEFKSVEMQEHLILSSYGLLRDPDGLHDAVEKAIARSEGSWSGSSPSHSAIEKALAAQPSFAEWEVDWRLLKIGEKIASGSCGDL